MLRNRDIRQIQAIFLLQRLPAYLLVLRYIQSLQTLQDKEQENKIVSFAYDPFGRRISKSIHREEIDEDDTDGDKDEDDYERPRATYYVYDNEDIIMEYNHKGKITARYTHGLGIDEPLSVEKKHNHSYYYHADGLGSITALSDERGRTVQTYDYDSFGNLKHHGHKVKQPYTYTGREWDKEIGLYYYRARYYDAKAGRFLSFDPILHPANAPPKCGQIGNILTPSFTSLLEKPQNLNPFVYTINNPNNNIDPTGLAVWVCNRKTKFGVGNHAYLWNDRNSTCCGMGSTANCQEKGPFGGNSCRKVIGSDGAEDKIMKCCKNTADKGIWIPPINDCHEAVDDCIRDAGLINPGAPGGRIGKPCDPCPK